MTRLQWRWGDSKAGQFDDSIGASRIKTVAKQALSQWAQDLQQKGTIKTDGFLLLMGGLTQQDRVPLEMVLKFKMRNQRDTLFEALSEWREAATFGF
ncbi:MAG: hypothetical protein KVP17_000610 [Porospora cf. gigantea B]|uniref:uncharacterized protein n=1 Tax=Porospora cf. gigantea B TaxID=2853592 RepID=UPI003571A8F6|nr:MAG: hypothetical protein KVP17_000610 [Porospora cf. gigantea B]